MALAALPLERETALVLGAGLAGLEAAVELHQRGLAVTLVAARAGRAELDAGQIAERHGFAVVHGALQRIEARRRVARVDGLDLTADCLVLAMDAPPLRPKGIEHTFSLGEGREGAARIERRLEALLSRGRGRIAMGFGVNPAAPARARATPVLELMSYVDGLLRTREVREAFELSLFAPAPPELAAEDVDRFQVVLAAGDVRRRFGDRVESFDVGGVELSSGARIHSDMTVFIPAMGGHPIVMASDLPTDDAGFVRIEPSCRVTGLRGVYAVGEIAALTGARRDSGANLRAAMARAVAESVAAARVERTTSRPRPKRAPPPLPHKRASSPQRDP